MKRKTFVLAWTFIFLAVVLSWTYPDVTPLGEKIFWSMGISPWSKDHSGLNYPGILTSLFFICGLFLLKMSVEHHHRKIVLAIIILSFWIPHYLVIGYQSTLANGIYTLDYEKNTSQCEYKSEEPWVTGTCSFQFTNYGGSEVQFHVSVRSPFQDIHFLQDLDVLGDELLVIKPHETKSFTIPFKKLSSDYTIPFGGSLSRFDMLIKDETRERLV